MDCNSRSCLEVLQIVMSKLGGITICVRYCCANKLQVASWLLFCIVCLIYPGLSKAFKVTRCHIIVHMANNTTKAVCFCKNNYFLQIQVSWFLIQWKFFTSRSKGDFHHSPVIKRPEVISKCARIISDIFISVLLLFLEGVHHICKEL